MKSLKAVNSELAVASNQLDLLHNTCSKSFTSQLDSIGLLPLKPTALDIFQINLGYMCNQTCKHCHVDAGPDRKEIMSRENLEICLDIIKSNDIPTVDLTGGAPEMNPHFRWFVDELGKLNRHVIVRCNLTIILANKKFHDLPEFFKKNKVEVVSSLPHYTSLRTDRQRGEGVFEKSIKALQLLNEVGYGKDGTGLQLNLVYNPTGAIMPGPQTTLEDEFKRRLKHDFDIDFNSLFVITNMPISRFLDFLHASGNLEGYMQKLVEAFNPIAAQGVMCRNTLSVSWDGYLFDCDFNQMLDLKVATSSQHIRDFDLDSLSKRSIVIDDHCYGCTAGSGSSCGGQTA